MSEEKRISHPEAVKKAMNLLLYKNRSEMELRSRLSQGGFDEEAVREAIEYVSGYGYLNDRRYAESYVYAAAGRKSRAVIRAELRRKGIDEAFIESALEEIPRDETALLRSLIEKRAGEPHDLSETELRRLTGYLGRRGFTYNEIRKAIRSYQEDVVKND